MDVEFLPWYHPTAQFTRCSACGSVVMSGDDQQIHLVWHETLREEFSKVADAFKHRDSLLKTAGIFR